MKEKLYKYTNNGDTYYFKDPQKTILHRTDGPALISKKPTYLEEWYQNDRFHRLDGPAIIKENEGTFYCVDGVMITGVASNGDYDGSYTLQKALDRKKREERANF